MLTFKHNKSWEQKRRITRTIPTELKRKVWKRDGGCCQYQDPVTGKRCGSKHKLEFEHAKPWSLGGEHSLENLWILCRNHTVLKAVFNLPYSSINEAEVEKITCL